MRLFFHKLIHWEYWPFQIVYIPVYFLWAFYAVKARSIFFFNACNPSIKNGGFMMESKKAIYNLIPPHCYPETHLVVYGTPDDDIIGTVARSGITYPLITKPDIGLRGSAVKKIHNDAELAAYNRKAGFNYLVQGLIPFPNEIGIFYVRYPHERKGRITGIVAKEFLIVTGDGRLSIEQLLQKDPRYELQLKTLRREYGDKLQEILPLGQQLNLVPYGNHARGAKFTDAGNWSTPALLDVINTICIRIPGFYYGRIDLMYNTLEELEQGKNFSIVELNGAASEPTHIYDPKHSLLFAWKELLRHTRYMYEISAENHKNGAPYLPYKTGMEQYRLQMQQNVRIVNF
jgi:hypothetical protein